MTTLTQVEQFCNTPTSINIRQTLDICWRLRRIAVVSGPSGIGKTTALRRYAEEHEDAKLIVMSQASGESLNAALSHVAGVLGVESRGRPKELREQIGVAVSHLYRDIILVVDEAQYLCVPMLNEFRSISEIYDLPILLCGDQRFTKLLDGARKKGLQHFLSFCRPRLRLNGPDRGDVPALCEHHRITGDRTVNFVIQIADNNDGLRSAGDLLLFAQAFAAADDASVRLKDLQEAAEYIGLSTGAGGAAHATQ